MGSLLCSFLFVSNDALIIMAFEANWGVPNVHFGYLGTSKPHAKSAGEVGLGKSFPRSLLKHTGGSFFSNAPTTKILRESLDYKVGEIPGL